MEKKKPDPRTVNPYDSKAYKRSNGFSVTPKQKPSNVNPYSAKPKTKPGS